MEVVTLEPSNTSGEKQCCKSDKPLWWTCQDGSNMWYMEPSLKIAAENRHSACGYPIPILGNSKSTSSRSTTLLARQRCLLARSAHPELPEQRHRQHRWIGLIAKLGMGSAKASGFLYHLFGKVVKADMCIVKRPDRLWAKQATNHKRVVPDV